MVSIAATNEIRRVLCLASSEGEVQPVRHAYPPSACTTGLYITFPFVVQEVRDLAASCCSSEAVPWSIIRTVVAELRRAKKLDLSIASVCRGSKLKLESPPPRAKSAQLLARNMKLQERLDNERYDAMVADVTVRERAAEGMRDALLPTVRLQMGFGLQVLVTMFTFFMLAYIGTKHFMGADELWAGLAGSLALTFGLLMETTLLIIRTNRPTPLHERFPELFDKKIWGASGLGGPAAVKVQGKVSGGARAAAKGGSASHEPKKLL